MEIKKNRKTALDTMRMSSVYVSELSGRKFISASVEVDDSDEDEPPVKVLTLELEER